MDSSTCAHTSPGYSPEKGLTPATWILVESARQKIPNIRYRIY